MIKEEWDKWLIFNFFCLYVYHYCIIFFSGFPFPTNFRSCYYFLSSKKMGGRGTTQRKRREENDQLTVLCRTGKE